MLRGRKAGGGISFGGTCLRRLDRTLGRTGLREAVHVNLPQVVVVVVVVVVVIVVVVVLVVVVVVFKKQ